MGNPFKFGTVVEEHFFTDREEDLKKVLEVINSNNHLILISPRRYGKTSLINKAVKQTGRPDIILNLQLITSATDLAAELLKRLFKIYPQEKVKQQIKHFRFIPTLSVNPVTDTFDIAFMPTVSFKPILEDVFQLIEQLGKRGKRPIIVLDEFQEIQKIDKNLDRILRAIIQMQNNVNYVFMGSQESLMREIFERKKSPFYHFGALQTLDVIPEKDFHSFLEQRFAMQVKHKSNIIAQKILLFTRCHPYYTQQLAFHYWNALQQDQHIALDEVIKSITLQHDIDFGRLWTTLNLTDRKLILELARKTQNSAVKKDLTIPTSTRYSSYKRLLTAGFLIDTPTGYQVEDPFFAKWLLEKRER